MQKIIQSLYHFTIKICRRNHLLRKNYVKNLRPLNLIVTSPLITKTVPGEGTKSIYFYSIRTVDILCLSKSKPESLIARRVNDGNGKFSFSDHLPH